MSLFDDAPAPGSSSAGGGQQQQSSSSSSSAPASSSSSSSYSIPAQATSQASQAQAPVRVAGNDYPSPRGGVGNVENSDHDPTISMTVFFLVLGVLYIGFCAYYRHRNKARRVMGDNNAEGGGGGVANMEGSRRRQRLENQASALSFSLTLRVCVCHVVSLLVPN